jgi:glyoxylase I family protein
MSGHSADRSPPTPRSDARCRPCFPDPIDVDNVRATGRDGQPPHVVVPPLPATTGGRTVADTAHAQAPVEGAAAEPRSPVTGFSHAQLKVSDVGASERWYVGLIGMRRFYGTAETGYVGLVHPPSGMVLALSQGTPEPAHPGAALEHIAFAVPDPAVLQEWADELTRLGYEHPGIVQEGRNSSLQLRDPDGLTVELVAPGPPVPRT